MKKLLILAGIGALAAGAHANLIVDGGFEMGDVYAGQFDGGASPWSTQYGYATNNVGNSGNNGSIWHEGNMRVMDGQAANNGSTGHTSWDAVTKNEGNAFLAVNGAVVGNQFVLMQTFTGSGLLNVSFDSINLYHPDSAGSSIAVFMDNSLIGSITTSGYIYSSGVSHWRSDSFAYNAGSGSHTLKLVATSVNFSGNDFGLDNVQVNAVPEPFTMSLGLASAGLFLRRRLKAKKA